VILDLPRVVLALLLRRRLAQGSFTSAFCG
jgi:hypothetical protein